jgi:hypothetical protein
VVRAGFGPGAIWVLTTAPAEAGDSLVRARS